jgi:hypothetical protein
MKNQDFNCSITANVSAEEAMESICHVSDWWAKDFTGKAEKLHDVFTVKFGTTFVTFNITEFVPDTKVVWRVTDCYLPWLNDKIEWKGTKVIFEITTENDLTTTIYFTHEGMVPQAECYDTCVKGWTGHITGSLQKLLKTGIGQPA